LALGVGLNTAVFSVIDALVLRRLPVANPEELVSFLKINPASQTPPRYFPYREFEELRARGGVFSGMFAHFSSEPYMQVGATYVEGVRETVVAARVSSNFFTVLGVKPVLGRSFTETDDRATPSDPPVILSYSFWQRRFAGDPAILGRQIIVARKIPFTIVGVAPPGFSGIEVDRQADMWWPLGNTNLWPDMAANLNFTPVSIMARLRPGATREAAQRLMPQAVQLESGATGQTEEMRSRFGRPLFTLMLSVSAVLLIASINVAGLVIARACERQRELSLRLALGGRRFRLIRQLLTESVVLAAAAGLGSLPIAYSGAGLLLGYAPPDAATALQAGLDLRSLVFTGGLVFFSAIIFGLVPAVIATNVRLQSGLQETRHSIRSRTVTTFRFLIPMQIALSLVLLVGAGLFARSLLNLRNLDPGFEKRNVVMFQVNDGAVTPPRAREMASRVAEIPTVESATFFANLGQLSGNVHQSQCPIDGTRQRVDGDSRCVLMNVGVDFFETMGTSLVLGRGFSSDDIQSRRDVVVINETMAKQYFGEQNPLGQRISGKEIIGVAKDAKYYTLREPVQRTMYTPIVSGVLFPDMRFAVRTSGSPEVLATSIRQVVREVTPKFQVTRI
jgi:predicted permease